MPEDSAKLSKHPVLPAVEEPVEEEIVVPEEVTEITPEFVDVAVYRQISDENSVYTDVLSHAKGNPFGDGSGRSTNVHETAHGIHAEVRNAWTIKLGRRVNAFYALDGKAIVVEEPSIRKSDVKRFVPQNLRSYRYNLYLEKQTEWDDTPLYVCDEWVAYVLGAKSGIEDVKVGKHNGEWSDGVSGCLDFSIYTVALCMAIKDGDPEYWKANKQFKSFVIWYLKEAKKTYLEGRRMKEFQWETQDKLLREFLTSESASSMRSFVKEELEGVWLDVDS